MDYLEIKQAYEAGKQNFGRNEITVLLEEICALLDYIDERDDELETLKDGE